MNEEAFEDLAPSDVQAMPGLAGGQVLERNEGFLKRFFLLYRIEITVLAGESRLMKRESGASPEQCPLL